VAVLLFLGNMVTSALLAKQSTSLVDAGS
jgi:hypothetical protein